MVVEVWLAMISAVVTLGGAWLAVLKIREGNRTENTSKRLAILESEMARSERLIAELQRQNGLLRAENISLRRLLSKYEQAGHESLIVTDDTGIITEWDAAATLMFGWSADEAVGKDVSSLIVPRELRQQHRVALANVFKYKRQPRTTPLKVKGLTKDNEKLDLEIQLMPGWETGDGTGAWRYGARIKKLTLPSPEAVSIIAQE